MSLDLVTAWATIMRHIYSTEYGLELRPCVGPGSVQGKAKTRSSCGSELQQYRNARRQKE